MSGTTSLLRFVRGVVDKLNCKLPTPPPSGGFFSNMAEQVDIYTTKALAKRFCKGECYLSYCDPQFFAQGFIGLGLSVRVVGKANMADCPIANRRFPKENFTPVKGTGDCGNTPTEHPIDDPME